MSTTYQVKRTRCSGFAPPSARIAATLFSVWRTWAMKSSGKWPWMSQPITPPVTTRRPSALMPLAYPFGAGQPLGCRIRTPVSLSEWTAEAAPFEGFTDNTPCLYGRHARPLRDLAQSKTLELPGFGLGQLSDIFDRARIFVRRDRVLDVVLQLGGKRVACHNARRQHHIGLDDHAARFVRRADHAAFGHRRMTEQRGLDLGPCDVGD